MSHPTGDALVAFSRSILARVDSERFQSVKADLQAVELTKILLKAHLAKVS